MAQVPTAPWHRASFDRFLAQTLPELLGGRLPMAGYHVERNGPGTCRVFVTLSAGDGDLSLTVDDVPACDEDGLFHIDGRPVYYLPRHMIEGRDPPSVAFEFVSAFDEFCG